MFWLSLAQGLGWGVRGEIGDSTSSQLWFPGQPHLCHAYQGLSGWLPVASKSYRPGQVSLGEATSSRVGDKWLLCVGYQAPVEQGTY